MSLLAPLLLVPLLLLALLIVLVVVTLVRPDATGLDRLQLRTRWIGTGIGVLVAVALLLTTALPGRLGLGALAGTAPLLGAAVLVLAVLLGERALVPPLGATRRAALEPHGVREVLPRAATAGALLSVLVVGGHMVMTSLLATPDDLGRAGRSVGAGGVTGDGARLEAAAGPYPGSWSTVPAALALVVLVLVAVLALRRIVSRRTGDVPRDLLARRRSAAAVLGSVMLGVGLLGIAFAAVALSATTNVVTSLATNGADTPGTLRASIPADVVALLVSAVAAVWGGVLVLAPGLAARRDTSRRALRGAVVEVAR